MSVMDEVVFLTAKDERRFCPSCGSTSMTLSTDTDYDYRASGMPVVLVGVDVCSCDCGERAAIIPKILDLHTSLASYVLMNDGLPTPAQRNRFLLAHLTFEGVVNVDGLKALVAMAMAISGDDSSSLEWDVRREGDVIVATSPQRMASSVSDYDFVKMSFSLTALWEVSGVSRPDDGSPLCWLFLTRGRGEEARVRFDLDKSMFLDRPPDVSDGDWEKVRGMSSEVCSAAISLLHRRVS